MTLCLTLGESWTGCERSGTSTGPTGAPHAVNLDLSWWPVAAAGTSALRPHAIDGADGYINSTSEHSGDGIRASYGPAKYQRLAAIKADYDPGNMFHLNANIPPD